MFEQQNHNNIQPTPQNWRLRMTKYPRSSNKRATRKKFDVYCLNKKTEQN